MYPIKKNLYDYINQPVFISCILEIFCLFSISLCFSSLKRIFIHDHIDTFSFSLLQKDFFIVYEHIDAFLMFFFLRKILILFTFVSQYIRISYSKQQRHKNWKLNNKWKNRVLMVRNSPLELEKDFKPVNTAVNDMH